MLWRLSESVGQGTRTIWRSCAVQCSNSISCFLLDAEWGGKQGGHFSRTITFNPQLVAQTSYVLNLNPDLRLSPGFMSRVGKGLALMRVDLIRNTSSKMERGDKKKEGASSESAQKSNASMISPGSQRCTQKLKRLPNKTQYRW